MHWSKCSNCGKMVRMITMAANLVSIRSGIAQIIEDSDYLYTMCPECGDGFGQENHYIYGLSATKAFEINGGGHGIDSTSIPQPIDGYFSDK